MGNVLIKLPLPTKSTTPVYVFFWVQLKVPRKSKGVCSLVGPVCHNIS